MTRRVALLYQEQLGEVLHRVSSLGSVERIEVFIELVRESKEDDFCNGFFNFLN